MITVLYFLSYILIIALPLIIGVWLHRTRKASWRLFFIGAVTFIASQVLHIPFNWLVLQQWQLIPTDTAVPINLIILAIFLGLSSGFFEEGARYLTYRFWAKDARTWGRGMMLGDGHGGIEAIVVAVIAAINIGALALMRGGLIPVPVPPEQMGLLEAQYAAVFDVPLYNAFLPLIERVLAICLHLALSLMVMQVFTRRRSIWLLAAILWHALANAMVVIAVTTWGVWASEGLLAVFALISLGIIYWLKEPEPQEPDIDPLPLPLAGEDTQAAVTLDMLERSRYT
ncbi:MAG: YhfC family intramembrane metalloprotease [Anaerolineales bacterium]|nr:YhfC family intramembrane metalloprotease [Anaerolineales bacterium]